MESIRTTALFFLSVIVRTAISVLYKTIQIWRRWGVLPSIDAFSSSFIHCGVRNAETLYTVHFIYKQVV